MHGSVNKTVLPITRVVILRSPFGAEISIEMLQAKKVLDLEKFEHVCDTPEKLSGSYIGGFPDWVQYDETPPACCEPSKFRFVGQVGDGDDFLQFPEFGTIYLFVCTQCWGTKTVFQCT